MTWRSRHRQRWWVSAACERHCAKKNIKHLWLYLKCDENEITFELTRASCRLLQVISTKSTWQAHFFFRLLSARHRKSLCQALFTSVSEQIAITDREWAKLFYFFIAFHVHKDFSDVVIKLTRSCDVEFFCEHKISVCLIIISHRRWGTSCFVAS